MNRRRCLSYTAIYIILFAVVPGCVEHEKEGYVHVDNGSEELMIVFVDGKQQARIGPGRCRKLTLPLGERAFKITQGDDVVYEKSHTLDAGGRTFFRPSYVLNPDQSNRYCDVEVVYHDEGFGNQNLDDLITMISNSTNNNPADESTEPAEEDEVEEETSETAQERRKKNRAIVRKYREITKNLVAMGDEAFFKIEHGGDLFKPLPMVVYSRQSGDQTRTTLARIPKVLHDYIAEAAVVKQPTVDELERLKVAHEVTISYVPFR